MLALLSPSYPKALSSAIINAKPTTGPSDASRSLPRA